MTLKGRVVKIYRRIRLRLLPPLLRVTLRPSPTMDLVRLGTAYGGWWLPERNLRPGARAYCAGAGEDISFDLALLHRGMEVHTFDPTPRAIEHIESLAIDEPGFTFHPVGWWGEETELRFYAPLDPSHVSHSVVNLQGTTEFFIARVKPVDKLMREFGHDAVCIVKMDIEGAEYDVLSSMIAARVRPDVICVEFDQPQPISRTLTAIRSLRLAGFKLVKIDGWNYTFCLRDAVPQGGSSA